jgi:hypothetical protein
MGTDKWEEKEVTLVELSKARAKCQIEINKTSGTKMETLVNAVKDWWAAYKDWERADTFDDAYYDSRMTIRTYNPKVGKDKSKWDLVHKETVGKPSVMDAQKKVGKKMKWDVSMEGIIKRTKPWNWDDAAPVQVSNKYVDGLHELCASLLDPQRGISRQVFHTLLGSGAKDGVLSVFMPLPQMEDLKLFADLELISKRPGKSLAMLFLMRDVRSRMTRLSQAHHQDMGSSSFASKPKSITHPGFHQGVSTTEKYFKRVNGKLKPRFKKATKEYRDKLTYQAIRYKEILGRKENKGTRYNEVIISYRKHANPMFPMFAEWDLENERHRVLKLRGKDFEYTGAIVTDKYGYFSKADIV